jgi:hypothetical protein
MAAEDEEVREVSPPTPAPPELCERAAALVRSHPECFWFWHPDVLAHPETRMRNLDDVRLVIKNLREHGGHREWRDAQELHKCLSPLYKKTSWPS